MTNQQDKLDLESAIEHLTFIGQDNACYKPVLDKVIELLEKYEESRRESTVKKLVEESNKDE